MKTIIAGSRSITDYDRLCRAVEESGFDITEVISGGADGVDALAERYAKERALSLYVLPADWDTHGNQAGPIRNDEMACRAGALIALWDGDSPGTRDMIEKAKAHDLEMHVVVVEDRVHDAPQKPNPLDYTLKDEGYAEYIEKWMEGRAPKPWSQRDAEAAIGRAETRNDEAIVVARIFNELYEGEWDSSKIGLVKKWARAFEGIWGGNGRLKVARALIQMAEPDKPEGYDRADFYPGRNQHRIGELADEVTRYIEKTLENIDAPGSANRDESDRLDAALDRDG